MFECVKLNAIQDYFKNYSERQTKGVYFGRITSFSPEVPRFIKNYLEAVKKCGVYIKGKIPNPDERQIDFLTENTGAEFRMDKTFLNITLQKWLPRLDTSQRQCVTDAVYMTMSELLQQGKNENMLKNAHIKFMCWFYYKFERILSQLGKDVLPKILYEGNISTYELLMLRILSYAGCDILILQSDGEQEYLKTDNNSSYSQLISVEMPQPFPQDFSVMNVEKQVFVDKTDLPVVGLMTEGIISTNTWITSESLLNDSLKNHNERGKNQNFYYNMFVRIMGTENSQTYQNVLFTWYTKLKETGRKIILVENHIDVPSAEEVLNVKRRNYLNAYDLIKDFVNMITFSPSREIEGLTKNAFLELFTEMADDVPLQRITNSAVSILCWLRRFLPKMFHDEKDLKNIPAFILYGVCTNANEALFLRLLARLPVDVMVICPDISWQCCLSDKVLFEKKSEQSMKCEKFPMKLESIEYSTVAYNAEKDLDTILYQDSGVYRAKQFKQAMPVRLQTTYDEIAILWNENANFRPGFDTLTDKVMVPVICAKICGVNGDKKDYFNDIARLLQNESTMLVTKLPFIRPETTNVFERFAGDFIRGGKLLIPKIKQSQYYQYGLLREEIQDYLFDKLQMLIDSGLITGMPPQELQLKIVSVGLNLNRFIVRMLQSYDFTKQIPKLVIVSPGEMPCSIDDSIMTAFLNLLGFDIAVFVPTGYQSVERFFTKPIMNEYEIGGYVYDMRVPDLVKISKNLKPPKNKLFRRGR